MKIVIMISLAALLLNGLAACSSPSRTPSTSNSNPPPPPPPPPTPDPTKTKAYYETAEYKRSYALSALKASSAYAKGHKGKNTLIAMIDSGIDIDHPEFTNKIHSGSKNIITGSKIEFGEILNKDGKGGHGTAVAGIMVANRDGSTNDHYENMHGIAYESKILVIAAANKETCESEKGCRFSQYDIANAVDYARQQGAKVINISLGSKYSRRSYLTTAYKAAVKAGIVIVLSAGNIGEDTPEGEADQPEASAAAAWADWSNGQIIAAGALKQNELLAKFSYKAGEIGKNVYLAAPGVSLATTRHGGDYKYFSGTSAAAPVISAAVAVVLSSSPNLTGKDAVSILFETATDLGEAGNDIIYGAGLINLEKALKPIGQRSIMVQSLSSPSKSRKVSLAASDIIAGGAFGHLNGLKNILSKVHVFDKYNRSFNLDMNGFLAKDHQRQNSIDLSSLLAASQTSRHSTLQFNKNITAEFYWQKQTDFKEQEERIFPHLKMQNKQNYNLRFMMTYELGGRAARTEQSHKLTFASGMSINEILGAYKKDDFLVTGRNDFTSLIPSQNMKLISSDFKMTEKTLFQMAMSFGNQKDKRQSNLLTKREALDFLSPKNQFSFIGKLSYRALNSLKIGGDFGYIEEEGSVLGSQSYGGIALGLGAKTHYVGFHLEADITASITFFAKGSIGKAEIKNSASSLIQKINDVSLSSFSAGFSAFSTFKEGDRMTFAVSQPLKVTSASTNISYVSGRDYKRNILNFSEQNVDLSPQKTEIDLEFTYKMAEIMGASLQLNLLHQFNPAHNQQSRNNSFIMLKIASKF